jgi:uncharacterized protein
MALVYPHTEIQMQAADDCAVALWRRLDVPGHDAARLSRTPRGWSLQGSAVWRDDGGAAALRYELALGLDWSTEGARVRGFLGDREIDDVITREGGMWSFNGRKVPGLEHLVDLDFGFTPATNLQQLRRVPIAIGEAADIPVAWVDAGGRGLMELQQRYERLAERSYRYRSATTGYEGLLELAPNGFAARYPALWEMLESRSE